MAQTQTAPCCNACGSDAPPAPPRNLLPSFVLTALTLAVTLGVANTTGIDWFELFIQVGLAAIGVTLYTGGGRSRGRSRRR